MTEYRRITPPVTVADLEPLKAGDQVLITGYVYTARDAAHRRMKQAIDSGQPLPFDIEGQIIYYVGPSPSPPGQIIGAIGPTTSLRMDAFTPALLAMGLKVTIGKGRRSEEVKKAMKKYGAIYLAALGGGGALLNQAIKGTEVIAYEDLGSGTIRRLTVENFPATVINDLAGNDYYDLGRNRYARL